MQPFNIDQLTVKLIEGYKVVTFEKLEVKIETVDFHTKKITGYIIQPFAEDSMLKLQPIKSRHSWELDGSFNSSGRLLYPHNNDLYFNK